MAEPLRSVVLLVVAQVAALSLWFSGSAATPALAAELGVEASALRGLAWATQAGFVAGALFFAATGLPDRFDPRRVFALCALIAAAANLAPFVAPSDGAGALAARGLVGFALAGVYPVGLKIAVGWSLARRGLVVSLLVGALALGSATPYLAALLGGADWRSALVATSLAAGGSAVLVLLSGLGPHHAKASRFDPGAARLAWRDPRIRRACLGYFGHMWELYAFWAWAGTAGAAAAASAGRSNPESFGAALAFAAIAAGAAACVPAGALADRVGKAAVARFALAGSLAGALASAALFAGPLPVFAAAIIFWGAAVIPDSPQFSALVADAAPPDRAGSLMTLQTAIGFAITVLTVEGAPRIAEAAGWPSAFLMLAAGPAAGLMALGRPGAD